MRRPARSDIAYCPPPVAEKSAVYKMMRSGGDGEAALLSIISGRSRPFRGPGDGEQVDGLYSRNRSLHEVDVELVHEPSHQAVTELPQPPLAPRRERSRYPLLIGD